MRKVRFKLWIVSIAACPYRQDERASQPAQREIHIILDNLSAHKTSLVHQFLAAHPNVQLPFTPTYSSLLNQVKIWFSKLQREVIESRHLHFRQRSSPQDLALHSAVREICQALPLEILRSKAQNSTVVNAFYRQPTGRDRQRAPRLKLASERIRNAI